MGEALVAFYDRAFLVGQSLIPAVNALLLGFPAVWIRAWSRGFFPCSDSSELLRLASYHIARLFGLIGEEGVGALPGIAVLPIATWELGLGVYLLVRGFRPSAVAELDTVPSVPGIPWPGRFVSQ